jgi:hypothetical protein
MPKYYIMLVDQGQNEMYVPVKAFLNPYNGQAAFASGMPQFFGGTAEGEEGPATVLDQEIAQESRRSLELTTPTPLHFFTRGDMFFYWADANGWQSTDIPWGSARQADEAEMDRIQIVDLTGFDAGGTNDELIVELIDQTCSQRAPVQGAADFDASATREAFIELLRLLLG